MELNQQTINSALRTAIVESETLTIGSSDKSLVSITFILVLNDKKTTNFMQSVDIFQKSKCCVSVEVYNTPLFKIQDVNKTIQVLIDTFNSNTYELVLAIPFKVPEYSYINKQYRELSTGEKSMTVHNFLMAFGVPHQTDENLFIL